MADILARATPSAELRGSISGVMRTIIENDYNKLQNLPSINGITLIGDIQIEDLMSGASQVVAKDYASQFPNIGSNKNIYVAEKENKTYRWDEESLRYIVIGSDYNDIKIINGGNANG